MADLMTTEDREAARDGWVRDFALNVDLFMRGYCGYWLRGAEHLSDGSWLVYECADGRDPREEERVAAFVADPKSPLPEGWYHWTEAKAREAYRIGERLWGERWLDGDHGDGPGYDVVVQHAMLGEVRYG